jgi:hypothetical protein
MARLTSAPNAVGWLGRNPLDQLVVILGILLVRVGGQALGEPEICDVELTDECVRVNGTNNRQQQSLRSCR